MSADLAIVRDEQESLAAEWANGSQCAGMRLGMADWLAEEILILTQNNSLKHSPIGVPYRDEENRRADSPTVRTLRA